MTISATATGTTFQPQGGGEVTGYNQCHTLEPQHLSTFQLLKCSFKARINTNHRRSQRGRVQTNACGYPTAPLYPTGTGSQVQTPGSEAQCPAAASLNDWALTSRYRASVFSSTPRLPFPVANTRWAYQKPGVRCERAAGISKWYLSGKQASNPPVRRHC